MCVLGSNFVRYFLDKLFQRQGTINCKTVEQKQARAQRKKTHFHQIFVQYRCVCLKAQTEEVRKELPPLSHSLKYQYQNQSGGEELSTEYKVKVLNLSNPMKSTAT